MPTLAASPGPKQPRRRNSANWQHEKKQTSLEAETVEAAWEEAQSLYPFADLALVADQDD